MAPSPAEDTTTCYLLDITPAEIRNRIFELALRPTETSVELKDAVPPSDNLIFASRQIHSEASEMYRAAYRDFWRNTHFTVTLNIGHDGRAIASRHEYYHFVRNTLRDSDLRHILCLSIHATIGRTVWTWRDSTWSEFGHGLFRLKDVMLVPRVKSTLFFKPELDLHDHMETDWWCVRMEDLSAVRREGAKAMAGKDGLTTGELEMVMKVRNFDYHSDLWDSRVARSRFF